MADSSFRRERFERLTDDEDVLTKLEDDFNEQSEEDRVERNGFVDSHSDDDIRREYGLPGGETETASGRRPRRGRAGSSRSDDGSGEPGGSAE